jgi:hypothetical protein
MTQAEMAEKTGTKKVISEGLKTEERIFNSQHFTD